MMNMTDEEASKRYLEKAYELAELITKLDDIRLSFEFTSNSMGDDASPSIYLENAIREVGVSLAYALVYSKSYGEEKKAD